MAGWEKPTTQECLDEHSTGIDSKTSSIEQLESNLDTLESQMRRVLETVGVDEYYHELWYDSPDSLRDALMGALTKNWWMSDPTAINENMAGTSNISADEFLDRVDTTWFRAFYRNLVRSQPIAAFAESYSVINGQRASKKYEIQQTHERLPECLKESLSE